MTTDPGQIRGQIIQTQQNLSTDVDALSEKLSPPRIAQRRVQRTRAAITTMKEKIMGSASSANDTASSQTAPARDAVGSAASSARDNVGSAASSAAHTVSSITATAGEAVTSASEVARRQTEGNPLAVGLIAFGAGWLISSLLPPTPAEQQIAATVKDAASEYGQPAAREASQAAQQAKDQLGESAWQAIGSVRETASDAVSTVKDQAQSATNDVTSRAGQAKDTVRDQSSLPGS